MTREAIEKAIKEHENALGLYTSPAGRNTVLRSLVDAVLEEAAKALCVGCQKGYALDEKGVHGVGLPGISEHYPYSHCQALAVRALKSQETAKP